MRQALAWLAERGAPVVCVDTGADSYLFGMAERIAGAAADAGAVGRAEAVRWLHVLRAQAAGGHFFSSMNFYVCGGTKR